MASAFDREFGGAKASRRSPRREQRRSRQMAGQALARSFNWYDDLVADRATSFREIAEREDVAELYIAKPIPMAFLDPAVLSDCLEGRTALSLTASNLALGVELPLTWTEQQR